ncbi:MAG TPA: penicillin-binding transpeptidase domain-containing protein [Pyrinomonadaceae bacterium]|nr:penicillin-binding transpeptidase domain-containing protein [Pyrinomonadaceae bacterium]
MFFISDKLYFKLSAAVFLLFLLFANTQAQTKKPSKTPKKTNETSVKTVTKSEQANREKAKIADQKRRAEELQRQKVQLEQKRRREQIQREQQAKKANFERGLRTKTVENISNDNASGEDAEIRRAAINALGNRAGTIVVLEVQTGKILTIINQDWAIKESFKPCSTIKLVTAIAGLNEDLINDGGRIVSNSFAMNLDDALAFSNNAYFQKVGANLGSNKMISYAQMLGLGAPTGINAENETGGKLPYQNENLRIYSHGDDFQVTPLQLAVMVSAISNGGRIIVPRIPKNDVEKANFRGFYRSQINLPKENLRGVIPGMVGAASYGTASKGVSSALGVAGKTGSCIGGGSWVGLFASVAPIQNPK